MKQNNYIVSFDDEKLVLVNERDEILGYKAKDECHKGDGILHRAFSIFVFNSKNELLLQQRSDKKMLWPLYWSNSCCSHPRKGESTDSAVQRRLQEELGLICDLTYLYKFKYQVRFFDVGSEFELCSIYIGKSDETPQVNANEIAAWKYINLTEMESDIIKQPDVYSPWFKMEWARIKKDFIKQVHSLKTS